jgi:hypothetical protein
MRNRGYHHIPPCGGLHSRFAEQYCPDCQDKAHKEEMLRLKRREIELMEMNLDIEPREARRVYQKPQPSELKPPIRRRGL